MYSYGVGYDVFNKNYVVTLGNNPTQTVVFDNLVNGWTSFMNYIPQLSTSLFGQYYTFKNNGIWKHYTGSDYNRFYNVNYKSNVTFIFNPEPTRTKTFQTINYAGSNGWEVTNIVSDYTGVDTNPQQPPIGNTTHVDVASGILSYDEGYYIVPATNTSYRAGFDRKQNVYFAAIKNASQTLAEEVITPGQNVTGIKGQYAVVTLQQDSSTDVSGAKQLFSVGTVFNIR